LFVLAVFVLNTKFIQELFLLVLKDKV